jgi:hypothetical protein
MKETEGKYPKYRKICEFSKWARGNIQEMYESKTNTKCLITFSKFAKFRDKFVPKKLLKFLILGQTLKKSSNVPESN